MRVPSSATADFVWMVVLPTIVFAFGAATLRELVRAELSAERLDVAWCRERCRPVVSVVRQDGCFCVVAPVPRELP